MTDTMRLNETNETSVVFSVKECDRYSKDVFVKITRLSPTYGIRPCNDFSLSPDKLRSLGQFFIEQAKFIEAEQKARD
jgi:hypothetical protein